MLLRDYMKAIMNFLKLLFTSKLYIFICIFLFGIYLVLRHKREYDELVSYEFNGVVENVFYDEKGSPSVTINDTQFHLVGGWNFKHSIQIGDSIIKKKNELKIITIDPRTGEVEVFGY